MKLCKDCRHYEGTPFSDWCIRWTGQSMIDPVTGIETEILKRDFCRSERGPSGMCGNNAVFWEAKYGKQ